VILPRNGLRFFATSRTRAACPDTCASTRASRATQEGRKGLYHINAVDEVTQWQIVAATAQISELWLLPVLEAMLNQFAFVTRGFHVNVYRPCGVPTVLTTANGKRRHIYFRSPRSAAVDRQCRNPAGTADSWHMPPAPISRSGFGK
jgi:hypothetical protein